VLQKKNKGGNMRQNLGCENLTSRIFNFIYIFMYIR